MSSQAPTPPVWGWMLNDEQFLLNDGRKPWRQAEEWMCDRHDWEEASKRTHDAVTDAGETVEIKSCVWRYRDGRTGRPEIWVDQYLGADLLGLVVYVELFDGAAILAHGVKNMFDVDCETRWRMHETMGVKVDYKAPKWTEVLTLSDVCPGFRGTFVDVLDDPDDAIVLNISDHGSVTDL
ncbi:hypothetical protein [Haloarcula rubripromontorii]|uniref:hypothetical protein n=1 Tax=Haloarcula rubripromontorii TaxID=1705562 RepID=UPI00345BDBB9